ncbi:MAG: Transcriptional regulator, AraC family protein [Labilithrix sp.]|nr:Transcriptional regulator, AraC family protein [Labilithrix sp.]
MERVFASAEPLDAKAHRILVCSDRYAAPTAERVLPDGAVHLIFNFGDRQAGERGAELACSAIGATCAPTRIVLTGAVEQLCVRLRVGAASAILGVPAGELTDHGIALDAIWGADAAEILERLHAVPHGAARGALLTALLRARVQRAEALSRPTLEAVRRISGAGGRIRVRDLADDLGLGERRLQQLFHQHVGLSPRAMCRLARFRDVLARCSQRKQGWAELALEGGFYDQAHFSNEIRTFTGLTPGELARAGDFGFLQEDCLARS